MNTVKFALLFIVHLISSLHGQAQDWTSYQSPNQVNDLVDTDQELFLATDEGLVVINKETMERTTFDMENSDLPNDHIQTIALGLDGNIWIGTYDVVLLQFNGNNFENSAKPNNDELNQNTHIYDLKIAPDGDLWVGTTDGVFHRSGEDWMHYGTDEFGPRFFEAWDIEIKDNGEVFVAGIDLHHLVDGNWTNIIEGTELEGYRNADLFTSSSGDLFFAGDLEEIGRFNGQVWQVYPIDFNGSEVVKFTEDTDGNVYFNTRQNGIFKLEGDSFVQQEDPQAAEFKNQTNYFHIDAQNRRWMNRNIHLSVNENGATRSTLIADHTLESNNASNVHKGANGKMYFMTSSEENFSVLDTEGNWSFLPKPPAAMRFEFMNDLLVLADDNIWLATNSGLYQYNGSEWAFTDLGVARGIVMDSEGKLYVRSTDKITIVDNGVFSEYNPTNSGLTSQLITGHGIDANDNLWVASGDFDSDNVIQRVTPNGDWTTYATADHPVIDRPRGEFHFDTDGNAWVVNDPFGALKFDGINWTNPIRENRDEIASFSVTNILSDGEGKIYFAHEYGLTTLLDGEWGNHINEEIPTRNTQRTSIDFDDEGTLWWGNGRYGVFSFMPEPTTSSFSPASTAIADFKVFPNPAQSYTTLDFTIGASAEVNVAVYNQLGQLASTVNLGRLAEGTYQREINLDRLPTGFYTVQLRIGNQSSTTKLIIE